jgi:hypothetical protein
VEPFIDELYSDNEVTVISRLDEVGYVVDMVKEEEPKSY